MTGALAVAAIVLVQVAGVAEAAPNPGDARPNPNQDIIAQGAGNLASGLFRGIPVGGYADRLADADGRLYLSGLDPSLTDRLRRTRAPQRAGARV